MHSITSLPSPFGSFAQSKGKGRGENQWVSPPGCLCFSFKCSLSDPLKLPFLQYLVTLSLGDDALIYVLSFCYVRFPFPYGHFFNLPQSRALLPFLGFPPTLSKSSGQTICILFFVTSYISPLLSLIFRISYSAPSEGGKQPAIKLGGVLCQSTYVDG